MQGEKEYKKQDDVVRLQGEKQFIKEKNKIKTIGQRLNEIKEQWKNRPKIKSAHAYSK